MKAIHGLNESLCNLFPEHPPRQLSKRLRQLLIGETVAMMPWRIESRSLVRPPVFSFHSNTRYGGFEAISIGVIALLGVISAVLFPTSWIMLGHFLTKYG